MSTLALLLSNTVQQRMRTVAPLQQQAVTSPIQNTDRQAQTHTDGELDRRCGDHAPDPHNRRPGRTEQPGTVEDQPAHVGTDWCLLYAPSPVVPERLLFLKHASAAALPVKASVTERSYTEAAAFWAMSVADKLTTAAAKGSAAAVEELLRAGAEVNGLNCFGRTALQVSGTGRAVSADGRRLFVSV